MEPFGIASRDSSTSEVKQSSRGLRRQSRERDARGARSHEWGRGASHRLACPTFLFSFLSRLRFLDLRSLSEELPLSDDELLLDAMPPPPRPFDLNQVRHDSARRRRWTRTCHKKTHTRHSVNAVGTQLALGPPAARLAARD